jgi:putative Mg2+ transporter-C (MgtC) family protein
MPRTNPARRTDPEGVPAEAEPTPLSGELDLAFRVSIALLIGLVLGTEREIRGHAAGMRTMALIGAGSCLFTGLGLVPYFGKTVDPTRIAAQIVTGVGFLGAGSILRQGEDVRGLTTAAMIWVVASLGMAVGFGYYVVAVAAAVMVILTLIVIKPLEERFIRNKRHRRITDPPASDINP